MVFGASVTALKIGSSAQAVKILRREPSSRAEGGGHRDRPGCQGLAHRQRDAGRDCRGRRRRGRARRSARETRRSAARSSRRALVVYDKIDGLKVVPQAGMARVGGNVFPKQLQQFEAIGISSGPDGKLGTADDLELGLVPVKWSVEEFTATFGDDDMQYVGTLDERGLFTPNVDGPNPKRAGNRNNVGDVWVVAELISADPKRPPTPLRARAQLLVTVPLYMAWFQDEGGR